MPLPGARVFTHAPLLGTVVEVQVVADPSTAEAADAAAVAEFERLNLVFSTHLRDSELARWRCGELQDCSPDLVRVLAAAAAWHRASGGAFDPGLAPPEGWPLLAEGLRARSGLLLRWRKRARIQPISSWSPEW